MKHESKGSLLRRLERAHAASDCDAGVIATLLRHRAKLRSALQAMARSSPEDAATLAVLTLCETANQQYDELGGVDGDELPNPLPLLNGWH